MGLIGLFDGMMLAWEAESCQPQSNVEKCRVFLASEGPKFSSLVDCPEPGESCNVSKSPLDTFSSPFQRRQYPTFKVLVGNERVVPIVPSTRHFDEMSSPAITSSGAETPLRPRTDRYSNGLISRFHV